MREETNDQLFQVECGRQKKPDAGYAITPVGRSHKQALDAWASVAVAPGL